MEPPQTVSSVTPDAGPNNFAALPAGSNDNDSLSEASDVAVADQYDASEMGAEGVPLMLEDEDDANAAPMHLHALRIPARLRGRVAPPVPEGMQRSRSTSRSRSGRQKGGGGRSRSNPSSRSSSPLPTTGGRIPKSPSGDAWSTGYESNSSPIVAGGKTSEAGTTGTENPSSASVYSAQSTLDGVDPDILTDRLGFIDLDPPLPHEIHLGPLAAPTPNGGPNGGGGGGAGLTPVNERVSDETLDDCHAFQDLTYPVRNNTFAAGTAPSTGGSSIASGSVGSVSGRQSRDGSLAGSLTGGSVMGDGDASVILATLDEESDEGSC